MGQYEVKHQCDRKCSDCRFFDYDEFWYGEEEWGVFMCAKGHEERITDWGVVACEDFEPDD